jgi:phosphoenolpyruvate carboxykinase (ATP)
MTTKLNNLPQVKKNLNSAELIERSIQTGFGKLSKGGALCVWTGEKTGRSAQDKFVVESEYVNQRIDWGNGLNKYTKAQYETLKADVIEYLATQKELYTSRRSVGAISKYAMNTTLFTTHPSHNLFFNNMFRNENKSAALDEYTVYHAPNFEADTNKHKTLSKTAIVLNFDSKEVLVMGTLYAGEIKKSIFSIMNFILPDLGVLPMHSGASLTSKNESSVFFGLSGTGKTTLSTDQGVNVIGDDEHGLCDEGVFNFEGGCYAKTVKLSAENEPEIYRVSNLFGTLLENIKMNEDHSIDFDDISITENGRSSYSLEVINEKVESGIGPVPKNIFFLAADAYGVLPPVARLTPEQSKYFFLLGYTAKVAGTEVGLKEPKATFSTCFGAPFMMRKPTDYSKLLEKWIQKANINVWLINTGWTGGPFGEGHRFPLKVTRQIIREIQNGNIFNSTFTNHNPTGLTVPAEVKDVEAKLLTPEKTWADSDRYMTQAKMLKDMMDNAYKKYQ